VSTESHVGGSDPDTSGRAVPPYEGRRESADVDPAEESTKDDAKVAGATGPVEDAQPKAADFIAPQESAVASPADEQPADEMPESEESDPGVDASHVAGTSRGEDRS
jgi:hypothetical protein